MADQSLRRTKSKQNLRKNPKDDSVTRHHVDYRSRSSSSLGLYLGLLGCFIVVGAVLLIAQAYRGPRLYDSTIHLGKNAVPSEGNSRETPIPKQETSPDKHTTEGPKPEPKSNSGSIGNLEDLVKRIKPSVVFIQVRRGFRASGQGSGFVVSSSGYILTCYHVIEGAADISVIYTNGEARTSSASLVWSQKDKDIALIRASRSDTFAPIELGDADEIGQGHQVVAIGYPLGSTLGIEPTVTTGIVSSIRQFGNDSRLFQISAPVNPGNSGGALISTEIGQAIGIVNAKVQNAEGIGFAIPITDRLKRFLQGRYLN